MKRVFSLLMLLLLLVTLSVPVLADDFGLVVDGADLLTDEQESALTLLAENIQTNYDVDAVIVTAPTLSGTSAQDAADAFAVKGGYREDSVLFLLAMEEREWYISTGGSCIYALTDYGIQLLGEEAVSYFGYGDYYGGFDAFLRGLPAYLDAYLSGAPIDGYADYSGDYYHGEAEDTVYYDEPSGPNYFLSLVIGLVVAAVVLVVMRSSMNTKNAQRAAHTYLNNGSCRMHLCRDTFLYSNITKTRKPQNTSSGGGSRGGGSSVHRSVGGSRRGGGGGRF